MRAAGTTRGARLRLDELLVARGLASSRAEAARLILAGRVRLPGGVPAKAGRLVAPDVEVEQVAAAPFVGRGGSASSSHEGRRDHARGALRVHAVDVGHGQLHQRLREDPRVVVSEGVNARHLDPGRFTDGPNLATVDVSFISLEKVLPAVAACLADPAEIVAYGPRAVSPRRSFATPGRSSSRR